jgi:UDP-glucose 4-epimerase
VLRLSNGFAPLHTGRKLLDVAGKWTVQTSGRGRQMILQSTGLQHRDFIAMSEICRLTESLIDRSFDAGVPGIVNIGSGRSQPVREMARFIQQRCQAVLNFYPQLTWSESVGEEEHFSLDYRSNGLSELNLMPRIDNTAEVDGLLAFCAATFGERPEI